MTGNPGQKGPGMTTDAGLTIISQVANLKSLNIAKTNITDEGLRYVSRLNRLENLNISKSNVSNMGTHAIASLHQLRQLSLSETRISSLAFLTELPNLLDLDLSATEITNASVSEATLPASIAKLDIGDTVVSDDGIPLLFRYRNLKEIVITRSKITKIGTDKLQQQFLDVKIVQ